MELHLRNTDDIELPGWIGASKLTLSEIGAVAVLACLQNGDQSKGLAERMTSPEMKDALAALKEKGVFNPSVVKDGGKTRITLGVELDVVAPDE